MKGQRARARRRGEYRKVLRIVEYNTGGPQPAMASTSSIRTVAAHAGMDNDVVTKRIRAAVENGDLLEHEDRVTLVDEGSIEAARDEAIEAEPTQYELVGECNVLLQDLREDG